MKKNENPQKKHSENGFFVAQNIFYFFIFKALRIPRGLNFKKFAFPVIVQAIVII